MDMSELQAKVPCVCGGSVIVRAKDAGGIAKCACGKLVSVPNLSKLREMTGAEPFVTNPAEAIRKLHLQGIDPAGDKCVLCGSSVPVAYDCHAVCESSHLKSSADAESPSIPRLLTLLFLPHLITWFMLCFRRSEPMEAERRGHDISISFNLPVCDPCVATGGNPVRPAVAKQLMIKVPAYKKLLEYYPKMTLSIKRAENSTRTLI
jgi:hypothetical protein